VFIFCSRMTVNQTAYAHNTHPKALLKTKRNNKVSCWYC